MIGRMMSAAILPIALSACAVGPNYSDPELSAGQSWVTDAAEFTSEALPDSWWLALEDDDLEQVLGLAAKNNLDLALATNRIREVRALRQATRSAFWPQLQLDLRQTDAEQSILSPQGGGPLIDAGLIPRDIEFATASLDASWELDLFGARRRGAEAANARLQATAANAAAVRLTVLADAASAYFELAGARERWRIASSNLASQERTLELTRRKVRSGLARRVDELRAEAQWSAARAQLPAIKAAIETTRFRLALLTGGAPDSLPDALGAERLPVAPAAVPVGLRADVLRRRPDVQAAERELAAATADVGVATADFFPRFVLSARYGFEAASSADIPSSRARTTAVVPFLRWPVFQGGRLRANLAAADSRAVAASLAYEKAVLAALADAESAIADYREELLVFERLAESAKASIEAAALSSRLYEQGLADFLTVLDAQRRRDEAADARAQSQTRALVKLVRVYKALGGGWSV